MKLHCLALTALLALTGPALAQDGTPINVLGTVAGFDAGSLTLKPDDGGAVQTYKLAPKMLVVQNKPATLADIKPDDFVASAAISGPDHKLHSTELRIFPPAMRGVGEGQRAMNDTRGQTMTNATVTGTAVADGSNDLKVKFEGGESELVVDPGVPVIRIDLADPGLVKPGVKVRVQGLQTADGATASRITLR